MNNTTSDPVKINLEQLLREGNIIRIKPQGYSMYPLFIPGRDEALIQQTDYTDCHRNDVVLYRRDQGILVFLPCGFLCYLFAPSVLNCQHFSESFITHDHPFFIGEFLFSAKSGLHSLHLQEPQQALSHTLLLPVVSVHKHSLPVPRAYK